jgi:hypothetical protein
MKQRNKITDIAVLLLFMPLALIAGFITWRLKRKGKL